jgi:hypothetical protein
MRRDYLSPELVGFMRRRRFLRPSPYITNRVCVICRQAIELPCYQHESGAVVCRRHFEIEAAA